MDSLQDAILQRFKVEKKKGGVNSPFNDAVDRVMKAIPDQKWSFGRWCGYLRNVPVFEIQSMIASAEKDKNVGRKFHWLVRQYKNGKQM